MALLYFHDNTCISPQQTFPVADIATCHLPQKNFLEVSEPGYEGIPPGILRRMGKAIRIGVGAALPLVKHHAVDGIIIGTANGGMEDCIKFLNQIIDYNEGRLTPGNFVGSTANAIAAQLGLLSSNKGYNNTHVQSGLSFENALLDAAILLKEKPGHTYLVGGADEISAYNYNIDLLAGWYKKQSTGNFYEDSEGSIPGEGAATFLVRADKDGAVAQLEALHTFHTRSETFAAGEVQSFIQRHLNGIAPDILLTGENGDSRFKKYTGAVEQVMPAGVTIARYKHLCGEYATSSAFAVWFACQLIATNSLPVHMQKKAGAATHYNNVLIYNRYKETQHSIMLVKAVAPQH